MRVVPGWVQKACRGDSIVSVLGNLKATKTSLENITSRYFNYSAIIPIRSTCTIWAKYPGTELIGTAFK